MNSRGPGSSQSIQHEEVERSRDPRYLAATPMLDYDHQSIQALVTRRRWNTLPESERIGEVYGYVRDEIPFGYNSADSLTASEVLADGYGQCNTKATLLMALLRAIGVPCRFHGAAIHKRLQKGLVNGVFYWLAPDQIDHTWAEVATDDGWARLEGVILDDEFLDGLRSRFPAEGGEFLGYAVGTDNLSCPVIDWTGTDTAIQTTGLSADHGLYDDPDSFYDSIELSLSGIKAWLFKHVVRHTMNRNVTKIRSSRMDKANLLAKFVLLGSGTLIVLVVAQQASHTGTFGRGAINAPTPRLG